MGDASCASTEILARAKRPSNSHEISPRHEQLLSSAILRAATPNTHLTTDSGFDSSTNSPMDELLSDDYDTDLDLDEATPPGITDKKTILNTSRHRKSMLHYEKACNYVGAIPSTRFVQQLDQSHVNMKHHILGPLGAKAVALELLWNTNITSIDLTDTNTGDTGGAFIVETLSENTALQELILTHNNLGKKTLQVLTEMLLVNKHLEILNLSKNNINDINSKDFLISLKKNTTLRVLDLSGNKLSDGAGIHIGAVIASNRTLESLDLKWNQIRLAGATAVCGGLRRNKSLTYVNLSSNGCDDNAAKILGESLRHNSTLKELDISNNRVSGEGFQSLAKGLERNKTLEVLRCGGNPVAVTLNGSGPTSILKAVLKNGKSALKQLNLDDIYPDKEFQAIRLKAINSTDKQKLKVICGHEHILSRMSYETSTKSKPLKQLMDHLTHANLSTADFFRTIGSDNGVSMSKERFESGLRKLGLLDGHQVDMLIRVLDEDNDGQIDFSEFLSLIEDYKKTVTEETLGE